MGKRSVRLAKLVVEKGFVSQDKVLSCLKELKDHSNFLILAQKLLEENILSKDQLDESISEMGIKVYKCNDCDKAFITSVDKQKESCPYCSRPFSMSWGTITSKNTDREEKAADNYYEVETNLGTNPLENIEELKPETADVDDEFSAGAENSNKGYEADDMVPGLAISGLQTATMLPEENYQLKPPPPHTVTSKTSIIGQQFGKYKILQKIAGGGMGVIYKAEDTQVNRIVALKMMNNWNDKTAKDRFLREAQTFSKLHHRNIIPVHEVGKIQDTHFIAMDFISGGTMAEAVKKKWFPLRYMLEAFSSVCKAIDFAHTQGVIHRDIKTSNILLDEDGVPLVTDFGLAQDLNNPSSLQLPTGEVIGSPPYMAPEQIRGEEDSVGTKSDIYSLGVVLYEILTGRTPFTGDTAQVFYQIIHTQPEPPSAVNPAIHQDLERITLHAMAKNLDDRYLKAGDIAGDIDHFLNGERVFPSPLSVGDILKSCVLKHRYISLIAGFFCLFILCACVLWFIHTLRNSQNMEENNRKLLKEYGIEKERAENFKTHYELLEKRNKGWEESYKAYLKALDILYSPAQRGRLQESLDFLDKSVKHEPSFILGYYQKARIYHRLCKWEEALKAYGNCQTILSSLYYQGKIYIESKTTLSPEEVRKKIKESFSFTSQEIPPDGEEEYYFMANAYIALIEGNRENAIRYCQRADRYHPFHPELYTLRGYIYGYFITESKIENRTGELSFNRWRNLQNAEIFLIEGLRLDPLKVEASFQIAFIRMRLGDFKKAQEYLDWVICYNTSSVNPYYYRGWVQLLLGKEKEAREDLEKVIDLSSEKTMLQLLISSIYIFTDQADKAMILIKKTSLINGEYVSENLLKVIICCALNEREEARECLRQIQSSSPLIWQNFLAILQETSNIEQERFLLALRNFNTIFVASPKSKDTLRAIFKNPLIKKEFASFNENSPYGKETSELFKKWIKYLENHPEVLQQINSLIGESFPQIQSFLVLLYLWSSLIDASQDKLLEYCDSSLLGSESLCYRKAVSSFRWLDTSDKKNSIDVLKNITRDLIKAAEIQPQFMEAYYGLATVSALLSKKEEAIEYLSKASALNWRQFEQTRNDPDFEALKETPKFQKMVGER